MKLTMDIHHLIQTRNNENTDELDEVLESITNKIELAEVYFKLGHVYCRTYDLKSYLLLHVQLDGHDVTIMIAECYLCPNLPL